MLSGNDIINNILHAFDGVAIFDQNYNQLFSAAKAIKIVVKENSKLMEHPIETGAVITDHRILLPTEIEMSLILSSISYADVYKQIKQFYLNATLLIIQTRSGIYQNQLIEALPHEEDPNMFNALTIALSLKEVLYVSAVTKNPPKRPSNTNAVDRGTQQGKPTDGTSALEDIFGVKKPRAINGYHPP